MSFLLLTDPEQTVVAAGWRNRIEEPDALAPRLSALLGSLAYRYPEHTGWKAGIKKPVKIQAGDDLTAIIHAGRHLDDEPMRRHIVELGYLVLFQNTSISELAVNGRLGGDRRNFVLASLPSRGPDFAAAEPIVTDLVDAFDPEWAIATSAGHWQSASVTHQNIAGPVTYVRGGAPAAFNGLDFGAGGIYTLDPSGVAQLQAFLDEQAPRLRSADPTAG